MIIIFILGIVFCYFKFVLHLHIDWKSFFKKGFKKITDLFRNYIVCWKATESGKTYSAIKYIEDLRKKDTIILTNVKSYYNNLIKREVFDNTKNIEAGEGMQQEGCHSAYYFSDLNQLVCFAQSLSNRDYIIFFDEIFTVLEKKGSLNKNTLSFISQLRKRGVVLVSTAQEWSEINITFRRYCRFQVDCNMFGLPFFNTAFVINKINDGDLIKWDSDLQDYIAPTIECNFRKGNKEIIDLYDTYETISIGSSINS